MSTSGGNALGDFTSKLAALALKPNVMAAALALGVVSALLNLMVGGAQAPMTSELEHRKIVFSRPRTIFYTLGVIVFGLIISGLAYS